MTTEALIALGGNIGDVAATMVAARRAVEGLPQTSLVAGSALYRTAAIGPGEQPDYLNAALSVATTLPAAELLRRLHAIEDAFGRRREVRWGARTLDLDLLAYGDCCSDDPRLLLPHPRMAERMFVLAPLAEIAADWRHPRLGRSVAELKAALDGADPRQRVLRLTADGDWLRG